jgi:diaminopimelate epimerase
MQFVKMHGLGNDFVIVSHDQLDSLDISSIASKISNRNTGIGCDQFIVYKMFGEHQYSIWIYNNDGSLAGACGNATRCIMKMLYMERGISYVSLDVLGRKLECRVISDDKFEANMGNVSFDESWMPTSEKIWNVIRKHSMHVQDIMCADLGNRHLVLFVDDISDDAMWMLGEVMEKGGDALLFPMGVNVSIAYMVGDEIKLRVWERQVGFTNACGSGACATVASAIKLCFVKNRAHVHFSTGILDISMKNGDVYMVGPATFVARGDVNIGCLSLESVIPAKAGIQ